MTYIRSLNPTSILADQNAETIARELLSHRKREKSGDKIRFPKDSHDNHPSLVVVIGGRNQGSWWEHREGGYHDDSGCAGGRMISFVMRFGNMDREAAHRWVRERYASQRVNLFNFNYTPTSQDLDEMEQKKKRFVRLLKESTAIKGTISEKYLTDERRMAADEFPTSLRHGHFNRPAEHGRWHKHPALLALALNKDGNVHCVHLIPLDHHGKKTGKTEFRTYKPSAAKGTAVILRQPKEHGVMWIAEGLETALSIWIAYPNDGVMAVGSRDNLRFASVPSDVEYLVFAQDNDRDSEDGGQASERTYDTAAEHYRSLGIRTAQVMPLRAGDDWNDVLRRGDVNTLLDEISDCPWKGGDDRKMSRAKVGTRGHRGNNTTNITGGKRQWIGCRVY